jgi:hypothetical protein
MTENVKKRTKNKSMISFIKLVQSFLSSIRVFQLFFIEFDRKIVRKQCTHGELTCPPCLHHQPARILHFPARGKFDLLPCRFHHNDSVRFQICSIEGKKLSINRESEELQKKWSRKIQTLFASDSVLEIYPFWTGAGIEWTEERNYKVEKFWIIQRLTHIFRMRDLENVTKSLSHARC